MKQLALAILCLALVAPTIACSSSSNSTKNDAETAEAQPAQTEEKTAQEWFIAGNDKLDTGEFEAAASMYASALAQDNSRIDIYVNKAIAESRAGNFDESVLTIEQAIANGGEEDPLVYFNLGNIYHRQGMYGYAARAYRNSLAYGDQENLDTLANLASSYLLMMEHEKARETYEFMRELAPDDPRPYVGLGLAMHAQQNREKALEYYDRAITADPSYPQAWYNRGDVHGDLENYEKAISDFERFLDLTNDKKMERRAKTEIKRLKYKIK
ncbi:MAG: tetratricopeptide repeat protein [Myxococcota bacterium]